MAAAVRLREAYELVRDVARVARVFQQDNVHCGGVTFLQFTILDHVLQGGEGIELADLHGLLAVEKSTTTRLLDPLVEKELLVKLPSARDPRAVRLALTAKGRAAHRGYWECLSERLGEAIAAVPAARYRAVRDAVRLFVRTVGRVCGDPSCCA